MSSPQGSQRLGKYQLREQLGRGGMAEVWKAFDTQLHRYVAIKILHADLRADPEFINRFTREARAIASLHHPNIVQIHDFQTIQLPESTVPIAYMVMDYIEGPTLAQYLRDTSHVGKFPPPDDILHLFTGISKAIDYAHQKGMIHRDIKPANIMLDKRNTNFSPMGEPVLTDFGIAKLIGVTSGTVSGTILGTPLYISPEQAQGQLGDERNDIYSLGVILYEICSGVQPFRGESATAITWQHIYSLPPPPTLINPDISPALAQVIVRALAKNPADRFHSASAMTAAIAEAFHLPVPSDLPLPTVVLGHMSGPTYTPTSPSQQLEAPPVVPYPAPPGNPGSPYTPIPANSGDFTPVSPRRKAAGVSSSYPPAGTSGPMPPVYPPPSTPWWRRRWLFVALVVIILLLLASSTIGALYLFPGKQKGPTPVAASQVVGSVYFLSSGQVNPQNTQGVDDEVQVNLHNIPNPAPGKTYYAWLRSVSLQAEGPWISMGTLRVTQGNAQLSSIYQDPGHANLLSDVRSFLVSEEDSNIVPISPSSDQTVWRFSSEPPALILLHLSHLLAGSPELEVRQLSGGLGYMFSRNTGKLVEWASSARDTAVIDTNPDTDLIHRQIIHILDFIDGIQSVSMDVPPNTPLYLIPTDASDGQIALVGPTPRIEPAGSSYKGEIAPGYVYLIPVHLDAAMAVHGATAQQHRLANQIHAALNQVTHDLEQARQYAKQLVTLSGAQLLTPQAKTFLNNLYAAVKSAYTGPDDPTLPQAGATGIYYNLQLLATFEVQKYTAQ
jgi:eukaryotic-like serine/threonine-protein kinase